MNFKKDTYIKHLDKRAVVGRTDKKVKYNLKARLVFISFEG